MFHPGIPLSNILKESEIQIMFKNVKTGCLYMRSNSMRSYEKSCSTPHLINHKATTLCHGYKALFLDMSLFPCNVCKRVRCAE